MLAAKCPGQDRRNWKPEDIYEHPCPHCGTVLEFMKTDAKTRCHKCGEKVLNPSFNLGCALWCSYADQCVGDLSAVFIERPEALRDRLEMEVRRQFIGESDRFQYTARAAEVASRLLETEKEADHPVVLAAVLFHDAGFKNCLEEGSETDRLSLCVLKRSREIAGEIMKDIKMAAPVQKKVLAMLESPWRGNEGDISYQLWHDILTLSSLKVEGVDKDGEVLSKLKRQSSINYAERELV